MAVQRAAPPALRWVALFLLGCAGLGLTLGFRDQIRRNPPAWYTGGREKAATGAGLIEAKEAVPLDSVTTRPTLQVEDEEPAPKPKAEEPKPAEPADDTPAATPPAGGTETPRPKPAPTPAPKAEPPSQDPVGDLLDAHKKAPETPPTVPY